MLELMRPKRVKWLITRDVLVWFYRIRPQIFKRATYRNWEADRQERPKDQTINRGDGYQSSSRQSQLEVLYRRLMCQTVQRGLSE